MCGDSFAKVAAYREGVLDPVWCCEWSESVRQSGEEERRERVEAFGAVGSFPGYGNEG